MVSFTTDAIDFADYPFPGASVHPGGPVTLDRIRDVDWRAWPPEIRTVDGETLFIPAEFESELASFCRRNSIDRVARPDIWADLLEPFLDTWFDPEDQQRTLRRLSDAGLSAAEITAIRERVTPVMTAYNVVVWEWVHLGLWSLLHAATGPIVAAELRAGLGDPAAFYAWAMEVADQHR
ncbi:hypothetical protein [Nocardia mexicana]|uniref:Uncharacterized protein n=1 Tax=Nocardia mexicana TaxID=279262 RepID=A0A370H4G7_9NOCA|nr:hypothetical protein [Nocardia mexicana]RDI50937.1 hypothetical protein DFR68_105414 [Nocardia mexicana]